MEGTAKPWQRLIGGKWTLSLQFPKATFQHPPKLIVPSCQFLLSSAACQQNEQSDSNQTTRESFHRATKQIRLLKQIRNCMVILLDHLCTVCLETVVCTPSLSVVFFSQVNYIGITSITSLEWGCMDIFAWQKKTQRHFVSWYSPCDFYVVMWSVSVPEWCHDTLTNEELMVYKISAVWQTQTTNSYRETDSLGSRRQNLFRNTGALVLFSSSRKKKNTRRNVLFRECANTSVQTL